MVSTTTTIEAIEVIITTVTADSNGYHDINQRKTITTATRTTTTYTTQRRRFMTQPRNKQHH